METRTTRKSKQQLLFPTSLYTGPISFNVSRLSCGSEGYKTTPDAYRLSLKKEQYFSSFLISSCSSGRSTKKAPNGIRQITLSLLLISPSILFYDFLYRHSFICALAMAAIFFRLFLKGFGVTRPKTVYPSHFAPYV